MCIVNVILSNASNMRPVLHDLLDYLVLMQWYHWNLAHFAGNTAVFARSVRMCDRQCIIQNRPSDHRQSCNLHMECWHKFCRSILEINGLGYLFSAATRGGTIWKWFSYASCFACFENKSVLLDRDISIHCHTSEETLTQWPFQRFVSCSSPARH